MKPQSKPYVSLFLIVVVSAVFGMIVASSLDLTQVSVAERAEVQEARAPRAGSQMVIPSFADIAEEVMPSVVSITSTEIIKPGEKRGHGFHEEENPFEWFFGPSGPNRERERERNEDRKQVAGGTGFVYSADGYIVTNNHVIENATKVEVRLRDKEIVAAKVIGRDPATDLALLKVEAGHNLVPARLGNSDTLRVGEWVMAIGDPLNYDKTVTVGVVSGKGRSLGISETTSSFENFIQTDAAINFGNSGGPLLNVHGEVIGINTAISRMGQNIGFAVPINMAKEIIPKLRDKGKVTRGYLGIRISNLDTEAMRAWGLKSADGALVQDVEEGKPAAKAGVQPGDVLIRVDAQPVRNTHDLIDYVSRKSPGEKVDIRLIRNGKEMTLTAKLLERPAGEGDGEGEESPESEEEPVKNKIGISLQELTPQAKRHYRIDDEIEGALVVGVKEVSPAADAGLNEGDIIMEVNGVKISTVAQLTREMQRAKNGDYLRFYVTRFDMGRERSRRRSSFFAVVKVED